MSFSSRERLTKTGSAVGTVSYMSREQFLGQVVDERTDVYSLGIVVLESISGEIAINGPMFPHIQGVLDQRLCGQKSPVEHRRLAGVLRKALQEEREAPYASVREFGEELISALLACPSVGRFVGGGAGESIPSQAATQTAQDVRTKTNQA